MKKISMFFVFTLAVMLFLPLASRATQEADALVLKNAFEAARKAEGVKLDDYSLTDQDGNSFNLSGYFKDGKPLVLSFIYTSCPTVCPTITTELKKAVDEARAKLGDRFNVLSVGFDTKNDTPMRLRKYGSQFVKDFKDIRFAAGEPDTIGKLAAQTGFYIKKQGEGSFDHFDMVTVIRPDGTIYKQVFSIRSQPGNLVGRLDELITGKPSAIDPSLIDRLKLLCYKYDPRTGQYVFDYVTLISVAVQTFVVLGVAAYLVWGRRVRRRLSKGAK